MPFSTQTTTSFLPIDDNEFAAEAAPSLTLGEGGGILPYPEPEHDADNNNDGDSLLHPPDFRPFFTVVDDAATGEHAQPIVHYVFADDDQDLITNAALETLSLPFDAAADESENVHDRMAIVDIGADGRTVVSTVSLSPDWQAVESTLTQAPSWSHDSSIEDRRLMLRISGKEVAHSQAVGKKKQGKHDDVEGLIKAFDKRLVDLDRALGDDDDDDSHVAHGTI